MRESRQVYNIIIELNILEGQVKFAQIHRRTRIHIHTKSTCRRKNLWSCEACVCQRRDVVVLAVALRWVLRWWFQAGTRISSTAPPLIIVVVVVGAAVVSAWCCGPVFVVTERSARLVTERSAAMTAPKARERRKRQPEVAPPHRPPPSSSPATRWSSPAAEDTAPAAEAEWRSVPL
jgi:hypothetical protein